MITKHLWKKWKEIGSYYVTLTSGHAVSDTFFGIFLRFGCSYQKWSNSITFWWLCVSIYSTGTSVPPNNQAIAMTMTDAYGKVEVFGEGGLENSIAHVSHTCNFIGK